MLLFALFVAIERRAPDPVLPFSAFRLRPVAVSNVGNMLLGVTLYGLTSFLPLFAQGVQGESAAGASAVLTPLLVGWSLAALGSGRLYLRFGFRATAALGTALIALGVSPLVLVGPQTPLLAVAVPMGIAGVGLGIASPAFLLAPQSAVPWHLRGAVTSSTQFARTIGGSLGVALLGALLNARLVAALSGVPGLPGAPDVASGSGPDALVSALLQPGHPGHPPPGNGAGPLRGAGGGPARRLRRPGRAGPGGVGAGAPLRRGRARRGGAPRGRKRRALRPARSRLIHPHRKHTPIPAQNQFLQAIE